MKQKRQRTDQRIIPKRLDLQAYQELYATRCPDYPRSIFVLISEIICLTFFRNRVFTVTAIASEYSFFWQILLELKLVKLVICVLHSLSTISASAKNRNARLPPEVNRVLFVRNLPFNITSEEMYDIFGKYGAIRQIRLGCEKDTRGTAFVVYEDIFDAKAACDHLNGFNVMGRYLIVLYYQPNKVTKKMNLQKKEEELRELKSRYGIPDQD
ncbi:unnamed protein product [Rhizophagus irregularis]|nr:unnamed protein product [Rhizophagus irregularis]